MAASDVFRRWQPIVARVKTRLGLKTGSGPRKVDAVLQEAADAFDGLLLDIAELEAENHAQRSGMRELEGAWDSLFRTMPIACVMTDVSGTIRLGNDRAAALLNTSARHLERERAPLMYFAQDRQAFFETLQAMPTGRANVRATFRIRPRERAPVMVDVFAVPRTADDTTLWLWYLAPTASVQASETSGRDPTSADVPPRQDSTPAERHPLSNAPAE